MSPSISPSRSLPSPPSLSPHSYQPLHPAILPHLDPEYINFHDEHLAYIKPSEERSWDCRQRLEMSPMGPAYATPKAEVGRVWEWSRSGKGMVKSADGSERDRDEWVVRVFTPEGQKPEGGWPVMVWSHGGGWVMGGLDSENGFLSHACKYTSCVVITVNYRHAPEHAYPAAINDVTDALEFIVSPEGAKLFEINPSKLVLGGLSAGGALTAILSLKASQFSTPVKPLLQLLICPVIDSTATTSTLWSDSQYSPWLTPSRMTWYREKYLPNPADASKWDASPNFAPKELLAKSPNTYLAVSECDLLAPEGLQYAKLLREAGVRVNVDLIRGGTHSILVLAGIIKRGQELVDDACKTLAQAIGTKYTYQTA